MFHTVYNSFETRPQGRDYIGKHSTTDPYDDYLGSFRDDLFNPDEKIVIAYAKTPQGAVWLEERFQRVFNVVEDDQFANKSYQTSDKFVTGFKGEQHPLYGVKRPDTRERNLRDNPSKRPEAAAKIAEAARKRKGTDSEETRRKKGSSVRARISQNPEYQSECGTKAAALKFYDPDHPELGCHNAGNLVQMQRRRGYPCGPANRVKVTG
jgi:hypothetical protein